MTSVSCTLPRRQIPATLVTRPVTVLSNDASAGNVKVPWHLTPLIGAQNIRECQRAEALLYAEIRLLDFGIVAQHGDRAFANDSARFHDVAAVGDGESREDVLLDEEHGDALLADLDQHGEELIDHHRSESEAHLVDGEELGRGHQRARDGAHLLLA